MSGKSFFGPTVVRASALLAAFGWGFGFYGPPVFLHAVVTRTGWPLSLVSAAMTFHFLCGAAVIAALPALHRRLGLPVVSIAGSVVLAAGTLGWSAAAQPWQLFVAAALTGCGWVTLGAAAINAFVAPWFATGRPLALAQAYNGATLGGVVFPPLWAALIASAGFPVAAAGLGVVLLAVVAWLSLRVLAHSPRSLGQHPDAAVTAPPVPAVPAGSVAQGRPLWKRWHFLSLAAAMALGLVAQVGLIAHLYSLLASALGEKAAGWGMALTTACALAGRMAAIRLLRPGVDRRMVACASYAVQMAGVLLLVAVDPSRTALVLAGVALLGLGIGNATTLPPLIAQAEFAAHEAGRATALVIAFAQAAYAFAPMVFGLLLASQDGGAARLGEASHTGLFAAAGLQWVAIAIMAGARARSGPAAIK